MPKYLIIKNDASKPTSISFFQTSKDGYSYLLELFFGTASIAALFIRQSKFLNFFKNLNVFFTSISLVISKLIVVIFFLFSNFLNFLLSLSIQIT